MNRADAARRPEVKQQPPSDLASIYRNLEMLEQQGFVYHLHLGHSPRHYRLSGPDDPCYLVCERYDPRR